MTALGVLSGIGKESAVKDIGSLFTRFYQFGWVESLDSV